MKFRKKCLYIFFAILLICYIICHRKTLPMKEYPLKADDLNVALQETGLSWTIVEEDSWAENHTVFTLENDGKMIADISNVEDETDRYLNISFRPSHYDEYGIMQSLPREMWEPAIRLGTLLYGGFKDERQVWKAFASATDEDFSVKERRTTNDGGKYIYSKVSVWKRSFADTFVTIEIGVLEKEEDGGDFLRIIFSRVSES